jgi:tRNA G18 (ribose-2'-O)-methylase SpoU
MSIVAVVEPDDPRLADYRAVGEPERARRGGFIVAEGRFVVERLVAAGTCRVRSLLVNEASLEALRPSLADLPDETPVFVAPRGLFAALTGFDIHRGCLALADRPPKSSLSTWIADARVIVVLEGCSNADNIGGVFRNAAAFGVDGVLLSPTCGDPLYRKAIRTSMGAVLQVPFTVAPDWPAPLDALRAAGVAIVALTPRLDAISLDAFVARRRPAKMALLIGAEGDGLMRGSLTRADVCVRIPIASTVDSLNLAVAAGIVLSRLSEPSVSDTR